MTGSAGVTAGGAQEPQRQQTLRASRLGALAVLVRRWDPLLRNGHLLTFSSLLTAAVGAVYWVLAARLFGASGVGRTYSAISVLMFLAGAGQLNLANTMVRFVTTAGQRTRRLVLLAYGAAAGAALLLGTGFVLLVPRLAPGLGFLHTPLLGGGFAVATLGYALFVLQDGVLTGLRRADWVVLENAVFALVKIVALAVLAAAGATTGVLGSWAVGLAVALVLTNCFVFGRGIPRHQQRARAAQERAAPVTAPTFGYLAADWVGSLCWLACITLPPVIVLNRLGAAASAYFSVAWLMAYALYQFAINMAASLIVESADEPALLRRHILQVLRHAGRLLGLGVLVTVVAAPWLLALFGVGYARGDGALVLRLLALSALPNLVVTVAVASCRVRRRMPVLVGVLAALALVVLALTVLLLPVLGIAGGGVAWLVGQCGVAGVLLWRRTWWLPAAAAPEGLGRQSAVRVAARAGWSPRTLVTGLLPIHRPQLLYGPAEWLTARRVARQMGAGSRSGPDGVPPVLHRGPPSFNGVLVLRQDGADGMGPLAVKHARNPQAAATLAREWEVLRDLGRDDRLGEWRRLLPTAVSRRLAEPLPLTTQTWLPGVPAEAHLVRAPQTVHRVSTLALSTLAELQRTTGRRQRVDGRVADWVDPQLDRIAEQVAWCRSGVGAAGLEALGERLRTGLAGREMEVGWTHGDFHPGNILLDQEGTRVMGVIDWGGALPDGPSEIDACTFLLTLRCQVEGQELGRAVVDVLRAGSLGRAELRLVEEVCPGSREAWVGSELALLTWLWHVRTNVVKAPCYARSALWVSRNVVPVLVEAVGPT